VVEAGLQRCAPLLEEISQSEPVALRLDRLAAVRSKFLEATAAFTRALTAQARAVMKRMLAAILRDAGVDV
jgi:hypothetical protein